MLSLEKGAVWPSFFVIPGLLLALVTSTFEGFVFYWLALVCVILPVLIGLPQKPRLNALTISVLLFIAWLLIHLFFLSPAFTTKGLYFICFLAAGFLLLSSCSRDQIKVIFGSAVVIFSILSIWAIVQYVFGTFYLIPVHSRVNTIFYTPNTFAAALNLVLLPLTVFYLTGMGRFLILPATLLLFTVLVLTQSRGGWLAFLAGTVVFLFAYVLICKKEINRHRLLKLVIAMLVIISVFIVSNPIVKQYAGEDFSSMLGNLTMDQIEVARAMRIETGVNAVKNRLKIFDIAWQRIKQKPWLGYGYNHFQYYQLSDQDMSRMGKLTKFVHNDYLQIWFETGFPGLVLLFVLIMVLYRSLFIVLHVDDNTRIIALGLLAASTAYFTHALVDFVLYPPVLLLMFGASLGVAVGLIEKNGFSSSGIFNLSRTGIRPGVARWMTGIFLLALLSQPAVAHMFYDQANRDKQRLDIKSALVFYELARRFAPWQPDYYFVEGDIWRHAALVTGEREPAERADKLFQQGIKANPFRMESLYLRALLHRDLSQLLPNPAGENRVLQWFEMIMQWHPHDTRVKLDYLLALKQYGRADRADILYDRYLEEYPESRLLQDFENVYDKSVIKRDGRTGGKASE